MSEPSPSALLLAQHPYVLDARTQDAARDWNKGQAKPYPPFRPSPAVIAPAPYVATPGNSSSVVREAHLRGLEVEVARLRRAQDDAELQAEDDDNAPAGGNDGDAVPAVPEEEEEVRLCALEDELERIRAARANETRATRPRSLRMACDLLPSSRLWMPSAPRGSPPGLRCSPHRPQAVQRRRRHHARRRAAQP